MNQEVLKQIKEKVPGVQFIARINENGNKLIVVGFDPDVEPDSKNHHHKSASKGTEKVNQPIKGEIYVAEERDNYNGSIFRFGYSNLNKHGYFVPDDTDTLKISRQQPYRKATLAEKAKLSKAEIENGFLWTGKNLEKIGQ